jgi:hypothetical protein
MTFNLFRSRSFDAAAARDEQEEQLLLEAFRGALAQKHSNPNRIGCPSHGFLLKLARHAINMDEIKPWTHHLSSCGECFRECESLKLASSPVLSGLAKALRRLIRFIKK